MNTLPPDTVLPPEVQQAIDQLAIALPLKGGTVTLVHGMQAEADVLCRAVLKAIPDTSRVAWVLNPRMSLLDFMRMLCQAFRVSWLPREEQSVDALEARLKESLRQSQQAGKQCVLVINQAQNAPFFALNRLSQFNAADARGLRLLQIVLIGQRSLRKMLEQPELGPTAESVVARHELLDPEQEAIPILDDTVNVTVRVSEWPALTETAASRFPSQAPKEQDEAPRRVKTPPVVVGAVGVAAAALVAWAVWPTGSEQQQPPASATGSLGAVTASAAAAEQMPAPAPAAAPAPLAQSPAPEKAVAAASPPAAPVPAKAAAAAEKTPAAGAGAAAAQQASAGAKPRPSAPTQAALAADGPQPSQPTGVAPRLSDLTDDQDATWPLLGQLWGVRLPAENACDVATGQRVQCFRYSGLSIEQVRLIDRPSMLLMAQNGVEKWVRLLAMDNSKALLASSGRQWPVALDDLKAMWTGVYATLWRLPPNHNQRVFAATPQDEAGRWLNQQLKTLQAKGALGPTEDSLTARVKAFQRAHKLRDDGRATPSTFVLVSRMVGVDEPDLRKPVR